jgi:hypothetical protein
VHSDPFFYFFSLIANQFAEYFFTSISNLILSSLNLHSLLTYPFSTFQHLDLLVVLQVWPATRDSGKYTFLLRTASSSRGCGRVKDWIWRAKVELRPRSGSRIA